MSCFLRWSTNSAPELAAQFELVVAGGDRDRPRVEQLRDLNRHHAQAAGCAPDQHEVARLDMRARHQHPPYRDQHQRHRRRLLEAQVRRLWQRVDRRHLAILAVRAVERAGLKAPDPEVVAEELLAAGAVVALAAGDPAMDHDLVADLDVLDLAAGLDHHAGRVGARDVRQDNLHPGQAAARPDIVEIAGRRLDLDHDVVGARLGFGVSRYCRTSQPPCCSKTIAFMQKAFPVPHSPERRMGRAKRKENVYVAATFNNSLRFRRFRPATLRWLT